MGEVEALVVPEAGPGLGHSGDGHHVVHVPQVRPDSLGHLQPVTGSGISAPQSGVAEREVGLDELSVGLESAGGQHHSPFRAQPSLLSVVVDDDTDHSTVLGDELLPGAVVADLNPSFGELLLQELPEPLVAHHTVDGHQTAVALNTVQLGILGALEPGNHLHVGTE